MQPVNTSIDGISLGVAPNNYRADPIERTAVGSTLHGKVHFLWEHAADVYHLTLMYHDLNLNQARRLLSAFGPRVPRNRVLRITRQGETGDPELLFWIPGSVGLRVVHQNGYWNIELETLAAKTVFG